MVRNSDSRKEGTHPSTLSSKRKAPVIEDDLLEGLESDDEMELTAIADKSPASSFVTPTNNRTILGLPTPSRTGDGTSRVLFPEASSSKRQKTVSFEESTKSFSSSGTMTPGSTSASPLDAGFDVTAEVMDLLKEKGLDRHVLRSVEEKLAESARKVRGILQGRLAAREAVRERDERIRRLQERVAALENKAQMKNDELTKVKGKLMRIYEEH
jgi:hypothetical protein